MWCRGEGMADCEEHGENNHPLDISMDHATFSGHLRGLLLRKKCSRNPLAPRCVVLAHFSL